MSKSYILNENSKKSNSPSHLKHILLDHQRAMLYRCITIENVIKKYKFPFGIMSDPAGSGKTLVALSLMVVEKKLNGFTNNIIIVPENILEQWITEIDRFTDLSYTVIQTKEDTEDIYTDIKDSDGDVIEIEEDLILMTSTVALNFFETIKHATSFPIHRIIIDEVDTLNEKKFKLPESIDCAIIWLISASVRELEDNEHKEYLGHTINVKDMDNVRCECDRDFLFKSIQIPTTNYIEYVCDSIIEELNLTDILNTHFPKVLKDINHLLFTTTKSIETNTVAKDEIEVVFNLLSNIRYNIKNMKIELDIINNNIRGGFNTPRYKRLKGEKEKIEKELDRNLNLLYDFKDLLANNSFRCFNCIKKVKQGKVCPECKVLFCSNCNLETCCVCNSVLETNEADYMEEVENNKQTIIKSIIGDLKGKKTLLYANTMGQFKILEKLLGDELNVKKFTSGNIKDMNKDLEDFKHTGEVLLVCRDYVFFGLNLEYVDFIIITHNVNEDVLRQIVGRGERYGRTTPLQVIKITNKNENIL
jgi:hypothetical protein